MPALHWGAETRADREANLTEVQLLYRRLDSLLGQVLVQFMEANEMQGLYAVGTSNHPPAWWLGNVHTAISDRPLHIQLQFEAIDRSAEPSLSVRIQGAAERFPQNMHTLACMLHWETGYRVRSQDSQGRISVWPRQDRYVDHGPFRVRPS